MNETEVPVAGLSDPRLAAHALSPLPVWLWSTDATRMLWANPTGAAIFGGTSPGAVTALRFEPREPAAAQVARLAGTLPQGGAARLERLRGFGAGVGGPLTCLCSRHVLDGGEAAVLIVATERAGPDFPLADRARRLLADFGTAAIFSADGELIEASAAARRRLGVRRPGLTALGAEKLAREATLNGVAEGKIPAGHVILRRLGAGATIALILIEPAAVADSRRGRPAPVAPCRGGSRINRPRPGSQIRRNVRRCALSGRSTPPTASPSSRSSSSS